MSGFEHPKARLASRFFGFDKLGARAGGNLAAAHQSMDGSYAGPRDAVLSSQSRCGSLIRTTEP
jgi:hypothetical protein